MRTNRPRLYLETTVPSYFTARQATEVILASRQHVTRMWWEARGADYDVYVSELVLQEAGRGDRLAIERRLAAIADFPVLAVTDSAVALAKQLLKRLPMPEVAAADALHLALASVHDMSTS